MFKDLTIKNSTAEFLIFTASTGQEQIHVRYDEDNVRVNQKMMAMLFAVSVATINEHIKNLIYHGEIPEHSAIRDFLITASDGKNYTVKHYNLQAVIALGFRVNSQRAVEFRQRASTVLEQFAIKGYVLDKKRLINGTYLGEKFFDDLIVEIREIRASERKFYQKITDIYATALDYNSTAVTTKDFFATVQNKLHRAIHGHTASELIVERADHEKPHMGLTTRKNAPDGKIIKTDVVIAKNYLTKEETTNLDRYITMYLDFAEDQASKRIPMTMQDRSDKLGVFLAMTGREVLDNPGKVTTEIAKSFAETEFDIYKITQDQLFQSDFDKFLLEM